MANSRYATIRSDPAEPSNLFLYTKTVERAHLPSKLWERVKLPKDYAKALELIDGKLQYWPKFLTHKCKQRLTRLTQVALRMRRLEKEELRLGEKIVPRLAPKIRRREDTRERKAERAAKVERAIERELVERLRSGVYGDKPLNVNEKMWEKVLAGMEREGEVVRDKDLDKGIEEEEEDELEMELEEELDDDNIEYVSDLDGDSEDEGIDDLEDWASDDSGRDQDDEGTDASEVSSGDDQADKEEDERLKKTLAGLKRKQPPHSESRLSKKKRAVKGPRTKIEYEIENEPPNLQYN